MRRRLLAGLVALEAAALGGVLLLYRAMDSSRGAGGRGSSSGLGEVLGRAARRRRACSNCEVLCFLKNIAEVSRCGTEVEHRACT